MRIVSSEEVAGALNDRALVEALRKMFASGCEAPARHHHTISRSGAAKASDGTLLLMPAWEDGGPVGVKIVTVYPDNGARGLPAVMGNYMLLDGDSGVPQALIDGQALTAHRTAAASALAADYLARADAHSLLMVGTGALAPHLVRAHAAVRPITAVTIWGRSHEKASALAESLGASLAGHGIVVQATDDLRSAAGEADVISCATLAQEPLVAGVWLRPGQHLDLVGGFTPAMREADDEAVRRARVYVDTRAGALSEAGDIVQPLRSGALSEEAIAGDLFELTRGQAPGRGSDDEITFFKSVGTALEDLAAAKLVVSSLAADAAAAGGAR